MVEHRNAVNFFVGMDERLEHDGTPGTWLAVTSLNFDISVLELFWSLTRGFHVLVQADDHRAGEFVPQHSERPIEFGAFYFSSDESEKGLNNKYQLLLEGARFADRNGFTSVWTPERHFHAFGGLYPNPSVTSAALSTITENVRLQAGSCVSPLHSPIRIAEEWSVVDNLSNGRVGISFAAGWQPNDFVIRPQNFANRREQMLEDIETVRGLWRGESRPFTDGTGNEIEIKILPRPVQDELPVWVTAAGNPATFEAAGKQGCNLLTHLLGQSIDELIEKVALYRKAYAASGAPGRGIVSLMLHTYVGDNDEVSKEIVRQPMKNYLRSAVGLVKAAAWSFPTFKKTTTMEDGTFGIDHLGEEEMDALLEHSFERYYKASGLFGSVQSCVEIVDRIKAADIDEIPCLIDFGIPTPQALEALPRLAEVLRQANQFVGVNTEETDFSVPALAKRYGATHFQCTPSQMTMLMVDEDTRAALSGMKKVLVGGEALSAPLARELEQLVEGDVLNMYGPTETTIWSSTSSVKNVGESVSIGTPIANTQIVILDQANELLPPGAVGELCIGGTGVVRGYLRRPQLTAERFIDDPNGPEGARLYRTGDRARFQPDGTLEFHGRLDHQVKLRGYRIELGEIEARLSEHPSVRAAAVLVREDTPGDKRLVGYVTRATASEPDFDLLKAHLAEKLPDYMVPALFVVLDRFPETPNRKTDRKALPAPEAQASANAKFVEPESQLEETISQIWCEVLALPRVGTHDNFFDIGGHSLLTIQVHGRLNETLDRKVSLVDLFRYPTVKSLSRYLDGDDGKEELKKTKERAVGRKAAMAKRRAARGGRRG
ncbi:MAG: natural product biosynthesis luciferase-like monooxygenase protein [Bradymonadia bacterium]|jgi:natural product biosynthesis luciferase-like monooxygenase protein